MIKLDAIINDKKLLSSIQKGVDKFNRISSGKSKLNLKINEKGFRQPLGRITGDLDKFESALAASNARVIAFGASTAVIGGITKAFKTLAMTTEKVQKQFADINRILNVSNRQFEEFSGRLFNIGKKTATSFDDASKAALEFARQGLGLNETLKRTSDALTLVRLTGVNADKAVSALTATVNAFQQSALTTTQALNKFVAVETQFAVSARDLMEGLGRVGSAAVDAKVNFNELNAMVAAVQQQTGRGGAVIGNALKTIFTRLQRTETLTALESYGVAVRNIEGETRPAMAILQDFAKTYNTLADSSKAYLREQVAGVFQANILSAIVKDLNSNTQVYGRALAVSTQATNEADQANAKLNATLNALLSQTGTELVRLQENIGKVTFEPIAKAILAPFKGLIEGVNSLIDSEGLGGDIANGILKGIRNVLAGPGIVAAIAVIGSTIFKTVGYMASALPTLVGITTQTQKRANLETTITAMLGQDVGLTRQVAANEGNAAVQAGILLGAAEKAKIAFQASAASTAVIANNLMAAGFTTSKMGAIVPRGRRGASGYIPGVAGEMHDIRRGVGGVSSSARPVNIPNFAFGGGQHGSMIANTGEYVVPNFKGGGSAVFNPAMVRANGGLPQGAKKITAAQGYVPNFAMRPNDYFAQAGATAGGYYSGIKSGEINASVLQKGFKSRSADDMNVLRATALHQRNKAAGAAKTKNLYSIPADAVGIGAIVGMKSRKGPYSPKQAFSTILGKEGAVKHDPTLRKYMMANKHKSVEITNIPVGGLSTLGKKGDADQRLKQAFTKKLNKFMLPALNNYSGNIFKSLLKDDGLNFIKSLQDNRQRVFSTSVEGGIFESALQLASRNAKNFSGDDVARFDFEESGQISPLLKKTFFSKAPGVRRADAKRSDSPPNILTLIGKSFGTPATSKVIKSYMAGDIAAWEKAQLAPKGKSPRGAGGYVPNFAGRGTMAARAQKGTIAARNAGKLQIATQSGLTALVKGIDYKIVGGKARFTAVGEQKTFGADLEKGGTSLMLADGRMVLSNKPLHGMAAMQAKIPANKIESLVVGGGFHNVTTGKLTFRESDFVNSDRLKQVVAGASGYIPNFAGGLGAAIHRERKAGVPSSAIRINSSPRFQSPSNPAGLAVTNKRDEPRGLRDVPNFQVVSPWMQQMRAHMAGGPPPTGGGAASPAASPKAAGMGGGMAAMGLMIAAPMVGGGIEQAVGGQTGGAISGAFTGAATGGMIGMMGPPIIGPIVGAALGAIIGALAGFHGAAETAAQSLQKFSAAMSTNVTAADAFLKAQTAMTDAKDMDAYRDAVLMATDALYTIDDEDLRKKLNENKNEFEALTKILKEYKTEQLKELVLKRAINKAETDVKEKKAQSFKGVDEPGQANSTQAAIEVLGKGLFTPIMSYFQRTEKTPTEMREIAKAFQTISGERRVRDMNRRLYDAPSLGFEGILHPGGQMSVARAAELLRNMQTGKGAPMFDTDEVGDLSKLFGQVIDPGSTSGAKSKNTASLMHRFIMQGGVYFLANEMIAAADEAGKEATDDLKTKQNFTEDFKKIVGDMNDAILNSARIQTAGAFGMARRTTRATGRASLLGRAVDPSRITIERQETAMQNLQTKREIAAQPLIAQFGGQITGALEKINKAASFNLANRQKVKYELTQPMRAGKIEDVIAFLEERLSITGAEGIKEKSDRKQIEDLARNLDKAWTKAQMTLDQEEYLINAKYREDLLRQQILRAERDIMFQKDEYLSKLRVQTSIEDAMLKSRLTDLELEAMDPVNIQGRGAVGREEYLAGIEEKKILARHDTDRKKLELQIKIEEAGIEASHLLSQSTIELVNVNYDLLAAITKLTTPAADKSPTVATNIDSLLDKERKRAASAHIYGPGGAESAAGPPIPRAVELGAGKIVWAPPITKPDLEGLTIKGEIKRSQLMEDIANGSRKLTNYEKQNLTLGRERLENLSEELEFKREGFKLSVEERRFLMHLAQGGELLDFNKRRDFYSQQTKKDLQFGTGWDKSMDQMRVDSESIFNQLGTQLPLQLKNGLVTAMEAGLDGAKSIGDAMRSMAVDVLKMIRNAFLQRIASNIVGALPGGKGKSNTGGGGTGVQKGGLIRAQGGLFVPGTGSGDTVPAMLEPQEYVLNRNAVAAMGGPAALDKINFGAAPRFGGRMALNEDPLSSRMSGLYYATGSPELDELIGVMRAKEEKRKAKKAEKRALWTSFATMLASAAVFKGMDAASEKGWFKGDKAWTGPRDFSTKGPIGFDAPAPPKKQYGGVVRRYGLGNGYQAGGAVRGLSAPSSNTNNININISTGSNNETEENGSPQQGGQNINADNGSSSKEFAKRISDAVKRVIAEEQRLGGSLSPGGRRR